MKTDAVRFSYYKKRFRRNIYLNRMNIPGKRRKLNGLRYSSKHTTQKESFNIPWKNCDGIQKEKTAILEVFVSEDDFFESSVSPSITAGCSLNDINIENDVGEILIDMSNINNNAIGENNVGNDISNEVYQHDLPCNNLQSESSCDSSFCLSSRDEDGDESLFGTSESSVSINEEENTNNNENDLYCVPALSEKKEICYGTLSCNFINCTRKGVALKAIQRPIKISATAAKRNYDRMVNTIKEEYRNECLERIGVVNHKKDKRQKIRICNNHKIETIIKQVEWIRKTAKEETKIYIKVKMNVPVRFNIDVKTSNHRCNRGNGVARNVLQTLDQTNAIINNSQNPLERASMKEMIDLQRNFGFDDQHNQQNINESIIKALGCNNDNIHDNTKIGIISYNGMKKSTTTKSEANDDDDDDDNDLDGVNNDVKAIKSVVRLDDQKDSTIKFEKGYTSSADMIASAIICFNGEIDRISESYTNLLTWFEELYLVETKLYGKVNKRWCDIEIKFGINGSTAKKIFDHKIKQWLTTRASWPVYVTHEEDVALRENSKWGAIEYKGKRIMMWDNTNCDIYKPTNRNNQALTWSAYYNNNCFKGAIFVQLCCWMGTSELWTGSITDTDYMLQSGILGRQQKWIDDNPDEQHIPWYNIMDKGYRVSHQAWINNNQHVLQPVFGRNGQKFSTNETLLSAAIAKVRSGNERGVNVVKRYEFVKHELKPGESIKRLADMSLAVGFAANFKYGRFQ